MPYAKFEREMNERERRMLQDRIRELPPVRVRTSLKLIVIAIACGLFTWPVFFIFVDASSSLIGAAVIAALGAMVYVANHFTSNWHLRNSWRRIERLLANGKVVVERIEATDVIEIPEAEDEGPTYFFDIGNGQILHVFGQDMYAIDDGRGPNSIVEFVTTPDTSLVGVYHLGSPLKPRRITGYQSFPEFPEGVFDGSLDQIEAAFGGDAGKAT